MILLYVILIILLDITDMILGHFCYHRARQAPTSILSVVQSCYAHQSKAHDKIYNSKGSNPTLKLPRIGL